MVLVGGVIQKVLLIHMEVVFLVSLGLPAAMGDIIMILTQLITRFEEARWQSQFCLCFLRGCILIYLLEPAEPL